MSDNSTVSNLLKRTKVGASKHDLTEHIIGNSSHIRTQICLCPIRASLSMPYGTSWNPNLPHHQMWPQNTFWSGNHDHENLRWKFCSQLPHRELDISLCDTKGRVYLLFNFSSQFIFQLINPFPSNLSQLSIITHHSSPSSCWEASIFQSSQALISSCLAWTTSILLLFFCPANSRLVLRLRKRCWNQDS